MASGTRGERILNGRYEIRFDLEHGNGGRVYAAWDRRFAQPVAIKEAREPGDVWYRAFLREAQAMGRAKHKRLASILDFDRSDVGTSFLVMEFLHGLTLDRILRAQGRLKPRLAAAFAIHVLEGLAVMHACGLVHRDLKPSNLILTARGAVIVDFGLVLDRLSDDELSGAVGTPRYMSPEQVRSAPDIDGRADLYGLGVVLYEMLSGRVPFPGEASMPVMNRHLRETPPPLDSGIPAVFQWIVMMALEKEACRRFQTAEEMRLALLKATGALSDG